MQKINEGRVEWPMTKDEIIEKEINVEGMKNNQMLRILQAVPVGVKF